MSSRVITLSLVMAAAVISGCAPPPEVVTRRPDLPDCTNGQPVFAPPQQGPGEFEQASLRAFSCFQTAVDGGEMAEVEFVLLGTEGEEYEAVLQASQGRLIDYFRENDGGWEISQGCAEYELTEPGIPDVRQCQVSRSD